MSEPLRVLTWNVDGLNTTRLGARMEKICLEILIGGDLRAAMEGRPVPPPPHVVALQEVVHIAQRGYFAKHFAAAGFSFYPEDRPGISEYWEMIAVRAPWRIVHAERAPFDYSPLGRALTRLELAHEDGREITVLTAHMESLRSGHGPRLAQAAEIDAAMKGRDAVFMGDTNLRESETRELSLSLRDAFEELGRPKRAAHTWWPEESDRGFRFDRVWLSGALRATALKTRRRTKLSDHAALEATLE